MENRLLIETLTTTFSMTRTDIIRRKPKCLI